MNRSPFSPFTMAVLVLGALLIMAAGTFSTAATPGQVPQQSGVCPSCRGSGTTPFPCPSCNGTGFRNGVNCTMCLGRGRSICASCRGTGRW